MFDRIHERIIRLSIRQKIILAMMTVSIGITSGVAFFALREQERVTRKNVENTGRYMVSTLADHITGPLAQSQYFEVREILRNVRQKDTRITLIAVNDMTTPGKEIVAAVGDSTLVRGTQNIYGDRIVTIDGADVYIFFEPIQIHGVDRLLGTARVGMSMGFMKESLRQTRDFILVIMAFAVALSILMAFIISDAVLEPLQSLKAGILRIAGGQFSYRIAVRSRDEIGQMATTFNRMTENLTTLQEISSVLKEPADSQEMLTAVVRRLGANTPANTGAMVFRGGEAPEIVAGESDGVSMDHIRRLRTAHDASQTEHPKPLVESHRICFPFLSEGEITGGLWMVRDGGRPIDEIDEKLLGGVSVQLETTLAKIEFQYRAVTDGLTGLFNHRHFQQEMTRQLDQSQKFGHSFTLVMADIDHFKSVNDTYGHPQGDVVLRGVADAIRKTIRGKYDIACRYGGEEFAIILPETALDGARIFAERFRKAVEDLEFELNGKRVKCTISVGLAVYPESGDSKRGIIDAADRALYLAKNSGRNNVKTYTDC